MAAPRTRDDRISRIARRQHGLITTTQLRACGLSDTAISKRVRARRLFRIHRGVYAVGHDSLSREASWMAAVLAVGDGAALARFAAALHWRIWRRGYAGAIDVVTPRTRRAPSGVAVHESRSLASRDCVRRAGIRVTTVARTVLDLGDELTPWQLANTLHEAAWRRCLRRRQLADVIARNRGRAAVTVLRRAIELNACGSAGTRSDFEDAVLDALLAAGVPEPFVNVRIEDGTGQTIEVDFHWPWARLVLEADGDHSRTRTKREDAERDRRLRAAGWTVVRCTPRDVRQCVAVIARMLG